jgi:glycosyltransferase involved in cell wall biosynthesis
MVSAMTEANLDAIWARRLAHVSCRLIVSQRAHFSTTLAGSGNWQRRHIPSLVHCTYPLADVIIAVSESLAEDLSATSGLPRQRILTVHNPIVGPEIAARAAEPVDHPWLQPSESAAKPVVLGVGRLSQQKDFPTLLRAFARLLATRPVRLIILGESNPPGDTPAAMAALRELAARLGIAADVNFPGYTANPFAYMARASLLALSSRVEGLPTVLIEAMACGCPIVSTDCPSGPAEILDGGRYGPLVPVGNDAALADAMARVLADPPDPTALRVRAADFSIKRATDAYLQLLFPDGAP